MTIKAGRRKYRLTCREGTWLEGVAPAFGYPAVPVVTSGVLEGRRDLSGGAALYRNAGYPDDDLPLCWEAGDDRRRNECVFWTEGAAAIGGEDGIGRYNPHMPSYRDLNTVWSNIKEFELQPIRQAALREVRIALIGAPGSGRHTLGDQMRTDPAKPELHSAGSPGDPGSGPGG